MATETAATATTPLTHESPAIIEKKLEVTKSPATLSTEIASPSANVESSEAPTKPPRAIRVRKPATNWKVQVEAEESIATPTNVTDGKVISDADTALESPLARLFAVLPAIISETKSFEMWGVELAGSTDIPTSIVLEKFLRANGQDVEKAQAQLTQALKWRKETNPRKCLTDLEHDSTKFDGLGFVTVYPKTESHAKEIVTWNIYGSVVNTKTTFGNVPEFLRWRIALMELSVRELDLASATVAIPVNGIDPYRMVQVHDYQNVSFLRPPPEIKAASTEAIKLFQMAYPELMKEKFFVNVPRLMGWMFTAMKLFLAPETVKKFHLLTSGSSIAGECKGWGDELPEAYGGKGAAASSGLAPKYNTVTELQAAVVPAGKAPAKEVSAKVITAKEVSANESPVAETPTAEVPTAKVPGAEVPAVEIPAEVSSAEIPAVGSPATEVAR